MKVLVVAEHDGNALRAASLSCFTFARQVADAMDGDVTWLVLGDHLDRVADQAAKLAPVLALESPHLARPLADSIGRAILIVAEHGQFELICAASSTFSKDSLPRAAALLGGAMASDVVRHEVTDTGLAVRLPAICWGRYGHVATYGIAATRHGARVGVSANLDRTVCFARH